MFRGVNAINLDDKGRVTIPTRYREQIKCIAANELIITIDTKERCLLLYPLPEWEIIEEKIERLPSFNQAVRRLQRLLLGHATNVTLDSNSRVLLPQPLRDYARLQRQMFLVGQGKKFELWDANSWEIQREQWLQSPEDGLETLPDDLINLSF